MKNEKIKTEEHIEYDSDDSDSSSSSTSSSKSSHYELKPEEYKTRTEESFTEYFKMGKGTEKVFFISVERHQFKVNISAQHGQSSRWTTL